MLLNWYIFSLLSKSGSHALETTGQLPIKFFSSLFLVSLTLRNVLFGSVKSTHHPIKSSGDPLPPMPFHTHRCLTIATADRSGDSHADRAVILLGRNGGVDGAAVQAPDKITPVAGAEGDNHK